MFYINTFFLLFHLYLIDILKLRPCASKGYDPGVELLKTLQIRKEKTVLLKPGDTISLKWYWIRPY
jgi:hypothetical protein